MGDSTIFDVEKLVTYGHELVDFLKNDGDNMTLKQYSQQCQLLHSRSDADLHDLQRPIQAIADQIYYLEQQSEPIEERRKSLKKLEQEDLRTEMKLSMYASVTSIIPNLDDQSKISGYIVENEKKAVGKFELDPEKQTTFEICNSIWKMINLCI
ncbi:hypothetical protein ACH5RR_036985 [Cinchona calisaya]|uniref:Kinetochore protein Spc24 n=1 Tax=Cinchona calisaya TaxID=153742 RepID=A0ABD2Y4T5_9GENT